MKTCGEFTASSVCALPTRALFLGGWTEEPQPPANPKLSRRSTRLGPLFPPVRLPTPRMSTSVPQGHTWTRPVKKEEEEEDPLDQLISRSGCAASHFAVQECMAQHQDWRQCQPQVQAFKDCMNEQQARRQEELQRRKEQASAHH
uniref:cytochrome c oxidase assembly factor 4 homolog, mitochondrial n=2 Tax=Cebidae TaxID=9498 RepID=UPI0004F07E1D|nr:cytochrome c oxidase assembly factor 4 homolog, mitochondrial [Callithrix jacchus]